MTNEEKINGIRRDYKKVRRVNSATISNLLNSISEERKTEIRNEMLLAKQCKRTDWFEPQIAWWVKPQYDEQTNSCEFFK